MHEDPGVAVEPTRLRVITIATTPDRRKNLIFCESPPVAHEGSFTHDAEVSQVLILCEAIETAFPLHTEAVRAFFERQRGGAAVSV